jgi:hypothetical protein
MAEGMCVWSTYHAWIGGSGGILPQKIFEISSPEMPFPVFWASKFALKFLLTILVFEIKEGENAHKIINNNLSILSGRKT